MAILPIINIPDTRLKVVSESIPEITGEIRILMDDMMETMLAVPGVGLSAIQIGVPKRIVVVCVPDSSKETQNQTYKLYLANPEIIWHSEELVVCEEGCLSLPDQYVDLERPAEVTVRYLNREGIIMETKASGLLARCIQHELDHLDGVLLVDHLSKVRRNIILRKIQKNMNPIPYI